ncbi:MAG: acetyl-CoA carboxylase biotin carboxylase subunit [Lentisphaerae bacterium]|jgi:acetyl-CoA carboxylase biotin carboxylase subunit|nr:acetyl-CoA carboxylase biotin carboxylase subunit [Lentisphaerota bacterium]
MAATPKILIANRGEIALRVIRACRELGLRSVLCYSTADRESLPVMLADEAVCIGPGPARDSYLKIDRIISAATLTGATAIHPGYGFMSENSHFAEICGACGLRFIGPSPRSIRSMGNKTMARELMREAGVPVVPGSAGMLNTLAEARAYAAQIGYPVLLKASAGGGGKGMRRVDDAADMDSCFHNAQREAKAAFGSDDLYMEKFLLNPKHVEVQILADHDGQAIHLGERDCSMQRRHQKLIEETPCARLDQATREKMCQMALRACAAANYEGVGTIEFLLDEDGSFYFMEMNTRIQVEHPVTEMATGIDLVQQQILVALGERLSHRQDQVTFNGHVLEVRINAEDPARNFAPCPGLVTFYSAPGGPGIRVDSHLYSGYSVPPHYDSLLGKLIVQAPDRPTAIAKARRALSEFIVEGIATNASYIDELLASEGFVDGSYTTRFIEQRMASI